MLLYLVGCGRFSPDEKRSFIPIIQRNLQNFEAINNNIRLPLSLYRALLNIAKENAWISREEYNYRLQQIPQTYLLDRIALRDTLEN